MNLTRHADTKKRTQSAVTTCPAHQRQAERRFCLNMHCLTDELAVYRVSAKAAVWLLTEEESDRSWLMMGPKPICPHCSAPLVK